MTLSKDGYPEGLLVRAVWDCCHELHMRLGRAPSRQEFMSEIHRREPERTGISTHSRQWGDWMRYHGFKSEVVAGDNLIPDEYLEPKRLRVEYAVEILGEASAPEIIRWVNASNAPLKKAKSTISYRRSPLTCRYITDLRRCAHFSFRSEFSHNLRSQLPVNLAAFCWRWSSKMQTGSQMNANTQIDKGSGRIVRPAESSALAR